MGADKIRLRMAGHHAQLGFDRLDKLWVVLPIKMPIGMLMKLVPTFVRFVKRFEESHWVGRMDQDWNSEFSRHCPDRVKTRIIDL